MAEGRLKVCHGCHGPIDGTHLGTRTGAESCTLVHYQECPGGYDGSDLKGQKWRSCPEDFTPGLEDYTDVEGAVTETEFDEINQNMSELTMDNNQHTDKFDADDEGVDSESELEKQEEEVMRLRAQVELSNKQKEKEETLRKKLTRDRRREALAAERASLLDSLKVPSKAPDVSVKSKIAPKPSSRLLPSSIHNISSHQSQVRSGVTARAHQAVEDTGHNSLTIDGIRALPGLAEIVENMVEEELAKIPSLARPHAAGPREPNYKKVVVEESETDMEDEHLYKRKSNGRFVRVQNNLPRKVPSARHFSHRLVSKVVHGGVSDVDSEDSQDDEAPDGYLFRYKRRNDGVKYRIKEKIRETSPNMVPSYVFDSVAGVEIRKMVPAKSRRQSFTTPLPAYQPARHDYRGDDSPPEVRVRQERKTPQLGGGSKPAERYPAFLAHQDEKEGKESSSKLPVMVQVARNCPVTWSNKVTTDKVNLALYCWATISELLASRTGLSPALKRGEFEARLQHTLHVLEIALQSSTQTDYDHTGWKVARLYHEKIQSKVDRGESSWLQFAQKHGTDSQTHELLAAERELAQKPRSNGGGGAGRGLAGAGAGGPSGGGHTGQTGERKRKCGSWNFSTVRGKCQFEIDNPDAAACNRLHECNYCSGKGYRQRNHQRSFCPKRQEAGDE